MPLFTRGLFVFQNSKFKYRCFFLHSGLRSGVAHSKFVLKHTTQQDHLKLASFYPKEYKENISGRSAAEVGGETILHMRSFQVCVLRQAQ